MDTLPLSLLNDFFFCARRAALKEVEGLRSENEHTLIGDLAHKHADEPGYEVAHGITLLRALPVWSERLGLSGRCDLVEVEWEANPKSEIRNPKSLVPVEFKKGKRRVFDNDDAQLCAQALCLEEMFGVRIERGAVFHAASKRRREVVFTAELRAQTEAALAELRRMLDAGEVPRAVLKPACEHCSLFGVCLPAATDGGPRAARLSAALFEA